MSSQLSTTARSVAGKAREVVAKVRPGATEAHRSLPIRGNPDEIRRLWADADGRAAVLEDIPVDDVTFGFGGQDRDWGTTVTVQLRLAAPVPGAGAQVLAGKVVRRLKALVETGEVPTTAHNPSARADADGASS
jgi:hypothetical protein